MIKIENHLGTIEISQEFIANLAGKAASECFGVVGMVNSTPSQGFRSLLSKKTRRTKELGFAKTAAN